MCCCCVTYSKKYKLRRRREKFLKGHKAVEGFDYSRLDSRIEREAFRKRASTPYYYKFRAAKRWVLISSIAILTGFVAVFMTICTRRLSELRFEWLSYAFRSEEINGTDQVLEAFLRNLLFVVSFAVLGYLIASREIMSHGGGLTKVKALLNGIKVPKAVRATTLLCKVFGTICTVISGLPAGKLAPLIHCGAIVGGGLSQGKTLKCKGRRYKMSIVGRRDFRNDREKRGFVTMGTAAGVASAFGAPIGGVLLCLEEGASWWSPRLNWRMTFCAMAASFVTSVLLSCVDRNGAFHPEQISEVNQPGVFSFGKFVDDEYSWAELPLFACLGIWGGLVGAAFNTLYIRLYVLCVCVCVSFVFHSFSSFFFLLMAQVRMA
jgi:chloride channel 7